MDWTASMVGFSIMAPAAAAIHASGSEQPPSRHHTLLHATVPFIAANAFLATAFGIDTLIKPDGSATYFARHVDWLITTPLLLAALVLLAFHERGKAGEVGGFLTSIILRQPHDPDHPPQRDRRLDQGTGCHHPALTGSLEKTDE